MSTSASHAATVRVAGPTRTALRELAATLNTSMAQVVADAVEHYRRRVFWDDFDRAMARLEANPDAWAAYEEDVRSLDGTPVDGLEPQNWEGMFAIDASESEGQEAAGRRLEAAMKEGFRAMAEEDAAIAAELAPTVQEGLRRAP